MSGSDSSDFEGFSENENNVDIKTVKTQMNKSMLGINGFIYRLDKPVGFYKLTKIVW